MQPRNANSLKALFQRFPSCSIFRRMNVPQSLMGPINWPNTTPNMTMRRCKDMLKVKSGLVHSLDSNGCRLDIIINSKIVNQ